MNSLAPLNHVRARCWKPSINDVCIILISPFCPHFKECPQDLGIFISPFCPHFQRVFVCPQNHGIFKPSSPLSADVINGWPLVGVGFDN